MSDFMNIERHERFTLGIIELTARKPDTGA